MRHETRLTALRAAGALASIAIVGCPSSPTPTAPAVPAASSTTSSPPLSCSEEIDRAFPGPDDYPGKRITTTARTRQCCLELIKRGRDGTGHHRWHCCANLDEGAEREHDLGSSCSPWGPPVPPPMRA